MRRKEFLNNAVRSAAITSVLPLLASNVGCNQNPTDAQTNNKTLLRPAGWTLPSIMDWTVLPSSIVAQCWVDSDYKNTFIFDPNSKLQRGKYIFPHSINFVIHEDTDAIFHLALPYFKPNLQNLTSQQLLDRLLIENNVEDLNMMLPPRVIHKAFIDNSYKNLLLSNPATALSQMGYNVGNRDLIVYLNTESTYHIPLLACPLNSEQINYDNAYSAYVAFMVGSTTS